jgi:hypothetical protein
MNMRVNHLLPVAVAALLTTGAVLAAPVTASSYDMVNGYTGSYHYWDQTYTGSGCVTCDGAALSGGLGDLTDGVIATQNWFDAEAPAGNGPYVGWTVDPTITFHFNASVDIDSATFYLDDSNGAGGVTVPLRINVNGVAYNVTDPLGSAPIAFTAAGVGFSGTDLVVSINRRSQWVFLSEVAFDGGGTSVPEPGSLALVAAALGAVGWSRRGRRA